MIKSIFKYQLSIINETSIELPKDAELLCVQVQHNKACVWFLADPKAVLENRVFELFGTGYNIECQDTIKRKYIDTFQMEGGNIVFHLFERLDLKG